MIDKKIAELINEQVNKELYSAYLYLDFANYFEEEGLDGFANWYIIQAQEEVEHGMKMRQYLLDNEVPVKLGAIAKPNKKFKSPADALKTGYEHEQYVTSLINNIYDAAFAAKEYKTMQFLDWFVEEQVEEEKNAKELMDKMKLFGGDAGGLYNLNKELKERDRD
jgi:ferritin